MERVIVGKSDSMLIKALQNDVRELNDALQTQRLKEKIIAKILMERDVKTLQKIAKAIDNANGQEKKAINKEEIVVDQGNK